MNILFVSPQDYQGEHWGGIMSYIMDVSVLLVKTGHAVSVLSPGTKDESQKLHGVRFYKIAHSSPTFRIFPEIYDRLLWAYEVQHFIYRHPDFKIVEAPEWGSSTLFCFFHKAPKIVVRLHKSEMQYKKENMIPLTISDHIINLFEHMCICTATAVTSPTQFMMRQYPLLGILFRLRGTRMCLIPNGAIIKTAMASVKKQPHNPYILTVGRIEVGKGSLLLLQAFARIYHTYPQLQLVFAGEDTMMYIENHWQSYKAYLRFWASTHGISARLRFVPRLPRKQLVRYYRDSLFYVVASTGYENASMALIEALSFGKAVVGSSAGGTPELVHHKINGLIFQANNVEDCASKMRYMLDHRKFRLRCEEKAHSKGGGMEVTVHKTELLYKELLRL